MQFSFILGIGRYLYINYKGETRQDAIQNISSHQNQIEYQHDVWRIGRRCREITEKINKTVRRALHFEESGETLSVEICLENVSPNYKKCLKGYLDTLYKDVLEEIIY